MRGHMTANVRWPKILRGSIAAVAAFALLFILLHLAHSTHPVSAAPPLQSSSTWTTYIDSRQDNGDDEYGYENNDFGSIDDDDFSLGSGSNRNTFEIDYIKWEDGSDDVQFRLYECLKPSEFRSLKLGSRTFTNPSYTRYSDSDCETRRTRSQIFKFNTSSNPLRANTRVKVTLTFNSVGGGTNPTPVPTTTPVPTQPPSTTASLSPDPATVNFRADGSWHRFTVNSSGSIRVYVNPGTTPLNVEVNTSSSSNHCGNGAERESKVRSNNQYVYLAGCNAGTGTVQLQTSSGTVIRTYTFSIGSGGGTNPTPVPTKPPTPVPTPVPTQPPGASASLSPDPSTVNFRAIRNQWHRFAVQSSTQVKVIANPTGSRRNVEINTSDPGKTHCAPEWTDTKTRSNGQYIYLEGCVSGTGTVELRRASDNALLRTYTFSIGSGGGTNPTPVPTPVPTQPPGASASLSPDPSTVNFRAIRNQWHRFTVQSSAQVKIIANPTGSRRNVEINTNDPGRTYCAPEWSDTKTRSNGQYIYLEGCVSGTGTVELRRSSDNALLRTYTFTIRSATAPTTTPTSTPTSTPVPTATPTRPPSATASLSPDPSTVNFQPDGSWRRFTVNSTGSIRVYTNPGSTPLNVEVYTSSTSNHCGNGAEREYKSRGNGQSVYLAGCQSGTGTVQLQTSSGTVIRTYTFSIGSGGGTNPTPTSTPTNTPTPIPTQPPTPTPSPPTAEFDPHPRRADMRSDGAWHRFEMDSNEEIKVVVNPSGSDLILKIAETNDNRPPSDNWCDSSAPKRRNKTLDNNNDFFLSACADGIATIHLESTSTRQVIRTYSFRVGPGSQPTATPTSTPVPTPIPTPVPTSTPTHTTLKHQSDHTVQFVVDNSTNMPSVFRTAIPTAATAWANELTASAPELNLRLCQPSELGCTTDNRDDYGITLKLVAGDRQNSLHPFADSDIARNYADCGFSVACVKKADPVTYGNGNSRNLNFLSAAEPAHIEDLTLIIEHPAYKYSDIRVIWSNSSAFITPVRVWKTRCGMSLPPGVNFCETYYLPATIIHELGHTLGLGHEGSGVMQAVEGHAGPESSDINLLKTLYASHTRHGRTPVPAGTSTSNSSN